MPLALAALLTGLVMSLVTRRGLFGHYWVLISFALTIVATVVLMQHLPTVSFFAAVAATSDSAHVSELRGALRGELLHAGVGVVLLLAIQMLNVYKPQGMTGYGLQGVSRVALPTRSTDDASLRPSRGTASQTPRWVQVVGIRPIGLAVLFVVFHLTSGGMVGRHGEPLKPRGRRSRGVDDMLANQPLRPTGSTGG